MTVCRIVMASWDKELSELGETVGGFSIFCNTMLIVDDVMEKSLKLGVRLTVPNV